jgi:hypothetical protein
MMDSAEARAWVFRAVIALTLAFGGWALDRAVSQRDGQLADHEQRIRMLERVK